MLKYYIGQIHLYFLCQRRAVFVRLCGMIKHRERQTETLFLQTNTTHSDMTYLRLPWLNTWEMQLVTTVGPENLLDFCSALGSCGLLTLLSGVNPGAKESAKRLLVGIILRKQTKGDIFSSLSRNYSGIYGMIMGLLGIIDGHWGPILFLFCGLLQSAVYERNSCIISSVYWGNRKESAKRVLVENSLCKQPQAGGTFVKVVYQKFNNQFTLACGPLLDT